jgi:hypothetical protein
MICVLKTNNRASFKWIKLFEKISQVKGIVKSKKINISRRELVKIMPDINHFKKIMTYKISIIFITFFDYNTRGV